MNAEELHDLYAPLWDKVPETRPKALYVEAAPVFGLDCVDLWKLVELPHDSYVVGHWDVETNATLCRVAVEDWLISQINAKQRLAGTGPDALVLKPNTALLMTDGGWDKISLNNTTHGGTGPTIHHALVATAMDVADA